MALAGLRLPAAALFLMLIGGAFLFSPRPALADEPAAAPVAALHDGLIAVMRNAEALGIQGRYQQLLPLVGSSFDITRMVRIAAGAAWSKASPAERDALASAFQRMTAATYADQFSGFDGERFETLGERPGPRSTTLVDTRLLLPDSNREVSLVYVVLSQKAGPKIVDILLDGDISQLAVRRSEYQAIAEKGGAPALTEALETMAQKLAGN
ncbi:MAG: ABC transporter substrate-binding protein [Rhodospirillales bacterium]